ncbi:hypothetical protein FPSE_06632 [Fusarium pseudograminearum CS3096]|uniref:3CxxC-type domain-containing protein n=1 Tax=Fusarium pseudograminearum (strain CS3096) TaxID=1028729 RepID=K3VJ31_FUSPC|nr:hypothetical protein FPSE_06632 [Fusarium pseudograminearum CS3096]EKJ73208.1 hypothetical protein FPSE_06632 [Fusarium pseudograminearum CS3096]KAF0638943.1 hypothetical protein FPSE5266_06632 [Fusarium pseudograminearum]
MPRRRKRSKEGPLWSMYPDLHDQVADKLDEVQLDYTFNPNDDDLLALESYDTNIMGTFACNNQKCTKTGWKSMVIAITIRQYSRDRYNARVYHQRCNNCKSIGKPTLDEVSYVDRVSYRIKKWNGVEMKRPMWGGGSSKGPHEDDLCEGCKAGHCEKGSKKRSNDDAWD